MNFAQAISVLRLLGTRPEDALTIKEIIKSWELHYTTRLQVRTAQRYLNKLSSDGAEGPALVELVDGAANELRYYLRLNEMAHWLVTEESALYQALSFQVLQNTFGENAGSPVKRQMDAVEHVNTMQLRTRRLRQRVRIVPDGLGRSRARVSSDTLRCVMDALASDQRLVFAYQPVNRPASTKTVSPLGLVAKDGTLYLIAVKGLADAPIHYALHRMSEAQTQARPAQGRDGFDLDDYIEQSHQLSHVVGSAGPTRVIFKVDPAWLYHFTERPLSAKQTITTPATPNEWPVVTVQMPITYMLIPFLSSFGPGVEVLEPMSLREELGQWLQKAASRY